MALYWTYPCSWRIICINSSHLFVEDGLLWESIEMIVKEKETRRRYSRKILFRSNPYTNFHKTRKIESGYKSNCDAAECCTNFVFFSSFDLVTTPGYNRFNGVSPFHLTAVSIFFLLHDTFSPAELNTAASKWPLAMEGLFSFSRIIELSPL